MSTGREQTERERVEYGVGGKPEETGMRMREEGQRIQYQAREQGENIRQSIASGLHTAAQRLQQQGMEQGRPGLATRVAEPLERSAQYLGTHSLPEIRNDARTYAREHPLTTAAGVFVAAFLAGRLLRRR